MVNAPETQRVKRVSTGRGGAANFKTATKLAKKNTASISKPVNSQSPDQVQDETALTRVTTKVSLGARFATGRGGAGNMLPSGEIPLASLTEPLDQKPRNNVTVGRGGAGNFKDVKSGRSASTSSVLNVKPDFLSRISSGRRESGVRTDRPAWGAHVPRIDAELNENAVLDDEQDGEDLGRVSSAVSTRSAPASTNIFGKIRRRLSSFGATTE